MGMTHQRNYAGNELVPLEGDNELEPHPQKDILVDFFLQIL